MKMLIHVLLLLILFSCGANSERDSGDVSPPEPEPEVNLPEVSSDELLEAVSGLRELSSFIVWQDGEILHELYTGNMNRNRPINIKSASKNIISSLIGIAVDHGYITDIDDTVSKYLPQYFNRINDPGKEQITIRHLLTMSSGLESTSFRNYGRWVAGNDWVAGALNGSMLHTPGERMRYSTGDTHILSALITEASGISTRAFAERYLFSPMNIRIGGWDREPAGYFFGGNNMAISPGALLDYGKLYLNGGVHNGQQLISAEWIEESLENHFERTSFNPRGHNYGYLWWNNTFAGHRAWFAWGYGGQYMFIIPELNAVVVLTGNPDSRAFGMNNRIYGLMDRAIVPFLVR